MDCRKVFAFFTLAMCCILHACEKTYVFDKDLAVTARNINLTQYEGETHITVYSDGRWDASLTKAVPWATLEIIDQDGIGDLLFRYSENQGIARRVGIALSKGQTTDTVTVTQKGMNTNPQLAFVDEILSVDGADGEYEEALVSNVQASYDMIECSAIYYQYGEPGPKVAIDGSGWIRSCRFEDDAVWFGLTANNTGERRSADIILRLCNDCDVDFSISLRLRQNAN